MNKPKALSRLPYPGLSPITNPARRKPIPDKITLPALNAKTQPIIEITAKTTLKSDTATNGSPCCL